MIGRRHSIRSMIIYGQNINEEGHLINVHRSSLTLPEQVRVCRMRGAYKMGGGTLYNNKAPEACHCPDLKTVVGTLGQDFFNLN